MTWPATYASSPRPPSPFPGAWTEYVAQPPPAWGPTVGMERHQPAPTPAPAAGRWASITVSVLTVLVAATGISSSFLDLLRIRVSYTGEYVSSTYLTAETGWSGTFQSIGAVEEDQTYAVVRIGVIVLVGVLLLAAGSGLSFLRPFRAGGLNIAAAGSGVVVAAMLVPILDLSAALANDDGGADWQAYSFRADLGPGGHLLMVAGVLAAIAFLISVAGAVVASRRPVPAVAPLRSSSW